MMYSYIVKIVDIITLIISSYCAIRNIKKINYSTRYIVYYTFFVICIVPLYLDYFIGKPMYNLLNSDRYGGFILSYDEFNTRILYDIFLLITQFILLKCCWVQRIRFVFGNHKASLSENKLNIRKMKALNFKMQSICLIIASVAPVITIIMGYSVILFIFGWRDQHLFNYITESSIYSMIEKISYLGVTTSLILLLSDYEETKTIKDCFFRIISILLLVMNICIEAKRSILFFAFIMAIVILIYGKKRAIKVQWIVMITVLLAILVIYVSVSVKTQSRGYSGMEIIYTTLRIDFFRDDTIKMAIYGMLYPKEIKILEYPFQSYIMQIRYLFILDILAGKGFLPLKGIGYNRFFTCALKGVSVDAGFSYMTTSMFDEAIANFGLIGFFIIPIVCAIISRNADKKSGFEQILVIGCIVLAMMYSLNYIVFFIEGTIVVSLILKLRNKK